MGSTLAFVDSAPKHRGPCGKACYGSFNAAQRSVRALQRTGKDRRYQGYLHPYVCKECRAYHVGHTEYHDGSPN